MEALTAWSTLALAVLTLALVIVAGVNFQKFVENVRLVAQSLDAQATSIKLQSDSLISQTESIKLQSDGVKAQTKSIDLQGESIKEQIKAIDLQAKSFDAQTKALELQNKDINLNYKPVVYIKGVVSPTSLDDALNPYNYGFLITNSGKLPARNVNIVVLENSKSENVTITNTPHNVNILNKASIYPGSDLTIWVPQMVSGSNNNNNIEFKFIITYTGDGIAEKMKETMKFINTKATNNKWVYVGPGVHIINNMPKIPLESGDRDVSQGRISIVTSIVDDILGLDFVIKADSKELTDAFSKISAEVLKNGIEKTYTINGGALTGLRSVNIIDDNNQLTMFGVSVFKKVANHLKSSE